MFALFFSFLFLFFSLAQTTMKSATKERKKSEYVREAMKINIRIIRMNCYTKNLWIMFNDRRCVLNQTKRGRGGCKMAEQEDCAQD